MTQATEYETIACPLCGRSEVQAAIPTQDRLCRVPGNFVLRQCQHCGLHYLSPRPTTNSIGMYYPADYEAYFARSDQHLSAWQRFSISYGMRKRCRSILREKPGGKLLDVGCATGQFLAQMQTYPGWELYGVEINAAAAEFARSNFNLNVHTGDLLSAKYPEKYFDAITLWDVIEHVHEPVTVLHEIRRILKPQGILVFRTPSLDSWDARAFGKYWAGLDSPRHLTVYRRRSVERLLDVVGMRSTGFQTGSGSYFVVLLSLRFWLNATITSASRRHALLALAGSLPVRLLCALPLTVADHAGLGSEMLVLARPVSGELGKRDTPP